MKEDIKLPGADWPSDVPVTSLAGTATKLVIDPGDVVESFDAYVGRGGYASSNGDVDLVSGLRASGLRGRGGAGFPMALKIASVRSAEGPCYVVANGEEGEPLSVKDRWLLRVRPHLVLDGLLTVSRALGAAGAYVYVSDAQAENAIRQALEDLRSTPLPVSIIRVDPAYVAGEETAVVRAINGGPALPVDKPPRPFEAGVAGRPTLISNVESLAHAANVYRAMRTGLEGREVVAAANTFLMTLSGAGVGPGLYEVPLGATLDQVLGDIGADPRAVAGALMGGYFAGLINTRILELPLNHQSLRDAGTGLGCGAIFLLAGDDCPVRVAADVLYYYHLNNAKQCGPCIRGTSAMSSVLDRLLDGTAQTTDLERLEDWSRSLPGRGACSYLDGASAVPGTLLREFGGHVKEHLRSGCDLPGVAGDNRLESLQVSLSSVLTR